MCNKLTLMLFENKFVFTGWSDWSQFCVVLQEILVQLGLDVLAVRVLAEGGTVRSGIRETGIRINDEVRYVHNDGIIIIHDNCINKSIWNY